MAKHFLFERGLQTIPLEEDGEWLQPNGQPFTEAELAHFTAALTAQVDRQRARLVREGVIEG